MAFTIEDSVWLEWLPTAAGLAMTQDYSLTQGGPKERQSYADACHTPDENDPGGPCWWDIQIFGWTDTVTLTAPGVPTLSDPRSNGRRNVPLLGWLKYLGDQIFFDIGSGAHFSVLAPSVSIGVRAPAGTREVGDQAQSNFTGAPMAPINVTTAAVNGILTSCVRVADLRNPTFTETRVIAASVDIPVPARARTLQIFENTASLPATPMNWVSDPITGFDLGQIDFNLPGAPGRTEVMEVPAQATIVRTGAQARTVTLVWGLAL